MKLLRNTVIRAGLEALYFSGAHYLLRPIFAGVGAIFMLHHVRPSRDGEFQPNHHLEVEPEFLRAMLAHLRAPRRRSSSPWTRRIARLSERNFARRFACFTLDDGYRDNRDFALPVMREFDAPFTVYVASDFAEGTGRLWWVALERVIAKASSIEVPIGGVLTRLDTSTPAAKQAAFDRMHDWLRALAGRARLAARSLRALHAPRCRRDHDRPRPLHVLGRIEGVRGRSAGDDRRAYDHALQSGADRAEATASFEMADRPRADRGGAAAAGASSRLSLWRPDRGRPARIQRWRRRPDSRPR